VNSIESAYGPSQYTTSTSITSSSGKITPSLQLSVQGISAACSGQYKVSPGYMSGNLYARANDKDADRPVLQLNWDIESSFYPPRVNPNSTANQYLMPKALSTNQCQSRLQVAGLHFKGSMSAKITDLFTTLIEKSVTSQLNGILCPKLKEAVDPLATNAIAAADAVLTKLLPNDDDDSSSNGTTTTTTTVTYQKNDNDYTGALSKVVHSNEGLAWPSTSRSHSTTLVNFQKDTPFFINLLRQVNSFFDCYYDAGGDCQDMVTKALKSLMAAIMGSNLIKQVHLPLPTAWHEIRFVIPTYGRILLDLQDIVIEGLEQLDYASLLSPLLSKEDKTISEFHTSLVAGTGLNITASVNITVFPVPGSTIEGDTLNELFHVHLNASSLNTFANIALGLDREIFRKIPIGVVLDSLPDVFHLPTANSSAERRCVLDSIHDLSLLDVGVNAIIKSASLVPRLDTSSRRRLKRSQILTKKLEQGLDELLNNALKLVLTEYQPLLTDAVSGAVRRPLKNMINHWIEESIINRDTTPENATLLETIHLETEPAQCTSGDEDIDKNHHEVTNFTDFSLFSSLNNILNSASTLDAVNDAIERWSDNVNNDHTPSSLQSVFRRISYLSELTLPGFSFHLYNLHLENLGSVDRINLLSPVPNQDYLRSAISIGTNKSQAETPSAHVSLQVGFRPRNLSAMVNVTVSLADLSLDGQSHLQFDITRLRQLLLSNVLSCGHCGLVPIHHQLRSNSNGSVIGFLLANASATVNGNASFQNFTVIMDTGEYPSVASLMKSTLDWMANTLKESLNSAVDSSTSQADQYCTAGQKFGYDDDPPVLNDGFVDEWMFPTLSVLFFVIVSAQAIFYFVQERNGDGDNSDAEDLLTSRELSEPLLIVNNDNIVNEEIESVNVALEKHDEVLFQSTALTPAARHFVVVFVVGTIILLASSNMSAGATVDLYLSWNESETFTLPSLFTFSLANTIRDMWNAKIYPLFFLVLIMSGVWPYMKLLMMLGSWILPTGFLSPETRETLLLTLDSLGKFALVDTYLFVIFMVAFRYHANLSDQLAIDVYVSPETGFYTFLAATCFSLLVGHFMVYSHRISELQHFTSRGDTAVFGLQESVLSHSFTVHDRTSGEERRLHFSLAFKAFVVSTALVAAGLLGIGITRKSFKFEIGGIAGDLLGDERIQYYSLLSLGSSLRTGVRDAGSLGVLVLESTYYFYAVATPFACLFLLLGLLVCPMTLRMQRYVLALAEIANAWSAVEVFVVSIIASLLEISTFATFIIGNKCDLIDDVLKTYFGSALDSDTDATCFTVRSSVEDSAAFLVAGALLNSFVVSSLLRFMHCSVAERTKAEMMPRLARPIDDALRSDSLSKSFADLLWSMDFLGVFIFGRRQTTAPVSDGPGASVPTEGSAGLGSSHRYDPQSEGTYSVTLDVKWDDSTLQDNPHKANDETDPDMAADSVEEMKSAFD